MEGTNTHLESAWTKMNLIMKPSRPRSMGRTDLATETPVLAMESLEPSPHHRGTSSCRIGGDVPASPRCPTVP